jgi:hypothetical protein
VIEFIATVGDLPEIRFATTITRSDGITSNTVTKAYDPAVLDTVGMLRPFWISYHGLTVNGQIREYLYYPLSTAVILEGQDIWSPDLSDTIRFFPNKGEDAIPSGIFRFVAQCKDDASAESRADVKDFEEGVVQIVVNFEPDTELLQVVNTYFIGISAFTDTIDFEDGVPDTVPYQSWIRLWYRGWDSPYDSSLCNDDVNECIGYQVQYERDSERIAGASSRSRWLPDEPEDNNGFGTTDSTSMNIGSVEYKIRARAVDGRGPFPELGIEEIEYVKADGTPPEFEIIGNYDPTLDSAELVNYDGTVVGAGDTIVWDWWNPSNYQGSPTDTLLIDIGTGEVFVVKEFYFDVNAIGHDHPKEDVNFGVQGWFYVFNRVDDGAFQKFARARSWVEGPSPNVLSDRHYVRYQYLLDPVGDPGGRSILDNPPDFWDSEYEFSIFGRDIALGEEFEQFMFVNEEKRKLNSYQTASLGRWTETVTQRFYLRMMR